MNTPAHMAASLLVWRNERGWLMTSAVALGATLPDAPMYLFYAYERFVAGSPEREIWATLYFQDDWQLFFDLFNSIPLMLVLLLISRLVRSRFGMLIAAGALLHIACDFPLHHDDAHRHFLPISDWRFASPFSYWDPQHFGLIFVVIEVIFTVAASGYVARRAADRPLRLIATLNLTLYVAAIALASLFWRRMMNNASG